jgi:hypothetical protein
MGTGADAIWCRLVSCCLLLLLLLLLLLTMSR